MKVVVAGAPLRDGEDVGLLPSARFKILGGRDVESDSITASSSYSPLINVVPESGGGTCVASVTSSF